MRNKLFFIIISLVCLLLLSASLAANASYSLAGWVVGGGGGASQAGVYQLEATIGQPAAGRLAGGNYELRSGFWQGGALAQAPITIYLPVITR